MSHIVFKGVFGNIALHRKLCCELVTYRCFYRSLLHLPNDHHISGMSVDLGSFFLRHVIFLVNLEYHHLAETKRSMLFWIILWQNFALLVARGHDIGFSQNLKKGTFPMMLIKGISPMMLKYDSCDRKHWLHCYYYYYYYHYSS